MLLIITNTQDATANYLAARLDSSGTRYLRIDTDTILNDASLSFTPGNPVLQIAEKQYAPADFTNVWYRRPERLKRQNAAESPEALYSLKEWTEALEGFFAHIEKGRWMNHPSVNAAASHKLEQLSTASRIGFNVPDTYVDQSLVNAQAFFKRHRGQIIAKPIGDGYVERPDASADSIIYTNRVTQKHLADSDAPECCPTLFQEYIQKQSDVRITCVDDAIYAVKLIAEDESGSQRCDIRRNNMQDVKYERVSPPSNVTAAVRILLRHYRLRFAAIDMAVTEDGNWYFLEVNPNGQWAWMDISGSQNIGELFLTAFSSNQMGPVANFAF